MAAYEPRPSDIELPPTEPIEIPVFLAPSREPEQIVPREKAIVSGRHSTPREPRNCRKVQRDFSPPSETSG